MIWLWDLDHQDYVKYQYLSQPLIHPEDAGGVEGLPFSSDGHLLASGHGSSILLWDPKTGEQVGKSFLGPTKTITRLVFSPDGKEMMTPGAKGQLNEWEVDANSPTMVSQLGFRDWPSLVSFVPGGKDSLMIDAGCGQLAETGGQCAQGKVSLWDLAQQPPKRIRLPGTFAEVSQIAIRSDGKFAASGHADGEIRIWDLSTQTEDQTPPHKTCRKGDRPFLFSRWALPGLRRLGWQSVSVGSNPNSSQALRPPSDGSQQRPGGDEFSGGLRAAVYPGWKHPD